MNQRRAAHRGFLSLYSEGIVITRIEGHPHGYVLMWNLRHKGSYKDRPFHDLKFPIQFEGYHKSWALSWLPLLHLHAISTLSDEVHYTRYFRRTCTRRIYGLIGVCLQHFDLQRLSFIILAVLTPVRFYALSTSSNPTSVRYTVVQSDLYEWCHKRICITRIFGVIRMIHDLRQWM